MANDTTTNPWVIDTASATAITAQRMRITGVRWVGATTAGHTATITNSAGKVVWTSVAGGSNYVEADKLGMYHTEGLNVTGLVVPTLSSGKLYIEYA